jgi:long-chain fatty acid transport protein
MKWGKAVPVFLVLLLTASTSFAAGFRLPEAGAKAMGMGFAFTAQADDPSAIYFNPAGITQLEGRNLMLGASFVELYGSTFEGETPLTGGVSRTERQETLQFLLPNFYYTSKSKEYGFSWGIGVFTPFGLSQHYESWSGSIFRNQAVKIDLKTVVVNPTIAFDINEALSVGFGIDYMYGMAKLGKTPYYPGVGNLYNLELDGDGDAWGYNVGILLKPSPNLKIGASYRSGFDLDLKNGDVDIRNTNALYGVVPALGTAPSDTKGTATVKLPATFAIGVAYKWDRLTLEADADWTFWSSYKSLPIEIRDEETTLYDTDTMKNWQDVCAIRLGAQYQVTDPLALRVGFAYDPTPVPAEYLGPELPDSDRLNYMVGAGYKFGQWTIDLAFMYIDKKDRTISNMTATSGMDGEWSGDAWLTGLDISYKF